MSESIATPAVQINNEPAAVEPGKSEEQQPEEKSLINEENQNPPVEKTDEGEKPVGAPEDYGDFEVSEGVNIIPEFMDKAKELFKECNLPKDQAQKFVTFQSELAQSIAKEQMDFWVKTNDEWRAQTKQELGDKYDQEMAFGKKAATKYFDDDMTKLADEIGLGNNPAFNRMMIKIGKDIGEDVPPPSTPSGSSKSFEENLKEFYSSPVK
jgi:hypothetical protein